MAGFTTPNQKAARTWGGLLPNRPSGFGGGPLGTQQALYNSRLKSYMGGGGGMGGANPTWGGGFGGFGGGGGGGGGAAALAASQSAAQAAANAANEARYNEAKGMLGQGVDRANQLGANYANQAMQLGDETLRGSMGLADTYAANSMRLANQYSGTLGGLGNQYAGGMNALGNEYAGNLGQAGDNYYNDVMGSGQQRYDRGMELARKATGEQYEKLSGNVRQELQARGLTGSSLLGKGLASAYENAAQTELNAHIALDPTDLRAQAGGRRLGLYAQGQQGRADLMQQGQQGNLNMQAQGAAAPYETYLQAGQAPMRAFDAAQGQRSQMYMQGLGNQLQTHLGTYQTVPGVIERRTDQGPDQGLYANAQQQFGFAQGGGQGGGGFAPSYVSPQRAFGFTPPNMMPQFGGNRGGMGFGGGGGGRPAPSAAAMRRAEETRARKRRGLSPDTISNIQELRRFGFA